MNEPVATVGKSEPERGNTSRKKPTRLEDLAEIIASAIHTSTAPQPPGRWSSVKRSRKMMFLPLTGIEWLTEWLLYGLKRWALVDVLQALASFSVLIAAFSYFAGRDEVRKEKQYEAWQVISSAQGKSGNGGRISALEDLNDDAVSLAGIDISKAWLEGVRLKRANLEKAVFDSTWFYGSDLTGAKLSLAHGRGAVFGSAKMKGASLQGSDIRGASFGWAMMENAVLSYVRAERSSFFSADLSRAVLVGGNFDNVYFNATNLTAVWSTNASFRNSKFGCHVSGADLSYADLRGADLTNLTGWREVRSLKLTNIHGVTNAPAGFVRWAIDTMSAVSIASDEDWKARQQAWSDSTTRANGLYVADKTAPR